MSPDRWSDIERLFSDALDRPAPERGAFLDRACVDAEGQPDVPLREEVESLLAAHAESAAVDAPLDVTLWPADGSAEGAPPTAASARPGERIGPYLVDHELGQGGMGTVFLAHRVDGRFERQVALKLVRADASPVLLQFARERFLRERALLAGLDHPAIARLLDGGETEAGDPYLAMEFVDGEPLTEAADRRQLSVDDRVRLFLQVCDGVAAAHRRLVVHRDLKPSNVFVEADDAGRLRAKILDFGIAKFLHGDDPIGPDGLPSAGGDLTEAVGPGPFTPTYAAPEQIRGEAVTTATDVWALGVLLHRLLAGRRPFRADGPGRAAALAALDRPPEPPSVSATRSPVGGEDTPERVAAARGTTPDRLARCLRGDLDAVVAQALRIDPDARYPTADALADDLRRHLDRQPVVARPPTRRYRAGRFVQRHAVGVAGAVGAVVLAAAFVGALVRQQAETARERDRAETTATFLAGLFEGAAPGETLGQDVTARELLDAGLARLRSDRPPPRVRARLLATIGTVYGQLGLRDTAVVVLQEALALQRETPGTAPLDLAATRSELGYVLLFLGRFDEARPLLQAAYDTRLDLLGPDALATAEAAQDLGALATSEGDYEEGRGWHRRAIAAYRAHPTDPAALANALAEAGSTELAARDLPAADAFHTEAFAIRRRVLPPDHPDLAHSYHLLGTLRYQQGRLDEAERLLRRGLAARQQATSEDSLRMVSVMNDLALVERTQGDLEGAERTFRQILAIQRRIAPDNVEMIGTTLHNLAWTLSGAGRLDEAERLFRESLALNAGSLGDDHLSTSFQWMELGRIELARGRPDRALPLLDRSLAVREAVVPPGSPLILQIQGERARALRRLGRFDEAERLLVAIRQAAPALGDAGAKYLTDADSQRVALDAARGLRARRPTG